MSLSFGYSEGGGLNPQKSYILPTGTKLESLKNLPTMQEKLMQQTDDFVNDSLYALKVQKNEHIQEREITYFFDVIQSHRLQMQSQITDYWLENGTTVQDTINISPLIITLSGLVGEVVYSAPHSFNDAIKDKLSSMFPSVSKFNLSNKLSSIGAIIPQVDNYTHLAQNAVNYIESSYNRYKKVWDNLTSSGTQPIQKTRQEQVFDMFNSYWKNRVALTVKTPYGIFEDMYIQNVSLEQGETNTVSQLSVTLKQLSFAEVKFTTADPTVMEKYNSSARTQTENKQGQTNKTVLKSMNDAGGDVVRNIAGFFGVRNYTPRIPGQ